MSSKFFHLNTIKVRVTAVTSIGSVAPSPYLPKGKYGFDYTVAGFSESMYSGDYDSEELAVAVHAKFYESCELGEVPASEF